MDNEKVIAKIKKLVNKYYDEDTYTWTAERSRGNYDDCFDDGFNCGEACLAYSIGKILGMDIIEPKDDEE